MTDMVFGCGQYCLAVTDIIVVWPICRVMHCTSDEYRPHSGSNALVCSANYMDVLTLLFAD